MSNNNKTGEAKTSAPSRLHDFLVRMGGEADIQEMYEVAFNRPAPIRRKAQQALGGYISRFNARGGEQIVPSEIKGKYALIAKS